HVVGARSRVCHSREDSDDDEYPRHGADHISYFLAMDLEILEALALSDDRSAALAQLLPGSEDHDYFRCLHAQHAGALDEAEQILDAWAERHGRSERFERV